MRKVYCWTPAFGDAKIGCDAPPFRFDRMPGRLEAFSGQRVARFICWHIREQAVRLDPNRQSPGWLRAGW